MELSKVNMGLWNRLFAPFIQSEDFDRIFTYLKSRSQEKVKIAPLSTNLFRAFRETSPDKVRVILCGFCPYHTFTKEGLPIADGLMMSCENNKGSLQPSLEILYHGIESDIAKGLDLDMQRPNSLEYLARQGVLLYNSSLSVEISKPGSHQEVWSKFNQFFWEQIVNKYMRGIPIIFFGKEAAKSEKYLQNLLHYPMIVDHPASASYKNGIWDHKNIFSKCNEILKQNNGEEVQWICKEEVAPW